MMEYGVVYTSRTGNTEQIAKAIYDALPEPKRFCRLEEYTPRDDELLFVGYWVDKGICCEEAEHLLLRLHNRRIALFGTTGTSDAPDYYDKIFTHAEELIRADSTLLGSFLCQGRMPDEVKQRYQELIERFPENENFRLMLENFEHAQQHPDAKDLAAAADFARGILEKADREAAKC